MTVLHDCDRCGKLRGGIDPSTGELDCDCPEWGRMTDEETELANEGDCPYWVPLEDDGPLCGPEEE